MDTGFCPVGTEPFDCENGKSYVGNITEEKNKLEITIIELETQISSKVSKPME